MSKREAGQAQWLETVNQITRVQGEMMDLRDMMGGEVPESAHADQLHRASDALSTLKSDLKSRYATEYPGEFETADFSGLDLE